MQIDKCQFHQTNDNSGTVWLQLKICSSSRNEGWVQKLLGWMSPRLSGHGHQHRHPDTEALWTSSLPKCLGPANLWQVLWAARREVCFMRKTFGIACFRDLGSICTVGFEPNIMHNDVLLELEEQYQGCGWQVSLGLIWQLFVYLLLESQLLPI